MAEPSVDRCHVCGRFVPREARGSVVEGHKGESIVVPGACPLGRGCRSWLLIRTRRGVGPIRV